MEKPTPVWAKPEKKTIEAWDGYWCICHRGHIITPGMVSMYAEKMNGVTFYAYHPAHIDLEAWKECPWCKAEYTIIDDDFGQPVHPNMVKFCWHCGKPLTKEAQKELAERLRGLMNAIL